MPVLVTDAHTTVGARIVRRILAEGGEVRAVGAGVDGSLRLAGAIVANADADDEGRLEAALEQVHTVIHPGPSLLAPTAVPAPVAAATLGVAAANAGVQRLIALSILGAGAGDEYRVSKGEAEALLAVAAVPTVVVRTGLVATSDLLAAFASLPSDAPAWSLMHAPLHPDDLGDILAALDNVRSTAQEGHVVFHATSSDHRPLGDWAAAQRGTRATTRVGFVHRPPGSGSVLESALAVDAWTPGPGDGQNVMPFLGLTARAT